MHDDDNQGWEREVGKRIASLIQSIGQGPGKPVTGEEQQKLKAAASRLDQMLKAPADADQQALRNATGKLDQLLADIQKGKDPTHRIKRRRERKAQRDRS